MKQQVEQDILEWITGYIEVDHSFYGYKFPPCPYARSARLRGMLDIQAYVGGGMHKFIQQQAYALIADPNKTVKVLALPAKANYYFWLHHSIDCLNTDLIKSDYYAQYGNAITTRSRYPSFFLKHDPYFVVIINRLSDVLDGHKNLLHTDYYKSWSPDHYHSVVERRQQQYEYHKRNKNEMD